MSTHTTPEWAGLEPFVDDLRRLEAPPLAQHVLVDAHTTARPSRFATDWRARAPWIASGMAAGVVAMLGWRVIASRMPSAARGAAVDTASDSRATRHPGDSAAAGARVAADANDPRRAIRSLLSPWPAVAWAQGAERAPTERYAPLTALDASRLRPGRRVYVRLSANDYHGSLPHETWTNTLDSVRYRGMRAWRLIRRVDRTDVRGRESGLTDTLWLRATDLRPLARHSGQSGMIAVAHRFTDTNVVEFDTIRVPDEVARALPTDARRRLLTTFGNQQAFSADAPFVASAEMLRLLLRAAPLRDGWRASVQAPRWRYNTSANNTSGWVNLRVAGTDTVQLFSGRFPAWRVVVESSGRPETWFVSQQTGETLVTDGPLDASYPESRTLLLYGLEETTRVAPVRRR